MNDFHKRIFGVRPIIPIRPCVTKGASGEYRTGSAWCKVRESEPDTNFSHSEFGSTAQSIDPSPDGTTQVFRYLMKFDSAIDIFIGDLVLAACKYGPIVWTQPYANTGIQGVSLSIEIIKANFDPATVTFNTAPSTVSSALSVYGNQGAAVPGVSGDSTFNGQALSGLSSAKRLAMNSFEAASNFTAYGLFVQTIAGADSAVEGMDIDFGLLGNGFLIKEPA